MISPFFCMSSQEISLENISNDVTSIRNKINELDLSNNEKEELETLKSKLQSIKDNLYFVDKSPNENNLLPYLIKSTSYTNDSEAVLFNVNDSDIYNKYISINIVNYDDIVAAFTTGFSELKTLLDSLS